MYTGHTLPSDSTVTVDAYDRRLDMYFTREGQYPTCGIKRERKGRFGEIVEKITREGHTLDWS